ncbi:MAG TPA: S26 family signal peptidase [Jatrophihabitans sp.]|nr:S26 family signal peptidase [Jatrophihabitans sp.]
MQRRLALLGLLAGTVGLGTARATLLVITIDGDSMSPSYQAGDAVLVVRRRAGGAVRRGDVVVCRLPTGVPGPSGYLVKRVAAVAGDAFEGERPVPAGQVYLCGDNPRSYDSRTFGTIPVDNVIGRVIGQLTRRPGGWLPRVRTARCST